MKVLRLSYLTEKGKDAINKCNEKDKKKIATRVLIRSTGGKINYIDGGLEFSHFIFKNMTGDLNSVSDKKAEALKKKGMEGITKALAKEGCVLDTDYKIEFVEVPE